MKLRCIIAIVTFSPSTLTLPRSRAPSSSLSPNGEVLLRVCGRAVEGTCPSPKRRWLRTSTKSGPEPAWREIRPPPRPRLPSGCRYPFQAPAGAVPTIPKTAGLCWSAPNAAQGRDKGPTGCRAADLASMSSRLLYATLSTARPARACVV